jgi:hypothetical protein
VLSFDGAGERVNHNARLFLVASAFVVGRSLPLTRD